MSQYTHHQLFLIRQLRKQITLDTGCFGRRLYTCPSHCFYELFGTLYKRSLIIPYQPVATDRSRVGHPPGHGEAIAMITVGQIRCNQRAAFGGRFHNNRRIAHSRHNTVTADKVMPVRISPGEELGKQTAICQHIDSRLAMYKWINTVQTMSQNCNSRHIIGQGSTMYMNINAVSETTHYQDIREKHGQIVHKIRTKLFAVLRCTARTYHIDNM